MPAPMPYTLTLACPIGQELGRDRQHDWDSGEVLGRLVRELGWPLGWTDLKPLGMDKFREWSRSHGGRSARAGDDASLIDGGK